MRKSNFLSNLIRELSYFSLREKRTLFSLVSIITIIILLPYFLRILYPSSLAMPNIIIETPNDLQRFPFNPNTISKDSLLLLGFSERQAQTFINYRNKSKGFHKKEDMKKLFFMTDTLYEQLLDYIVLPERKIVDINKKYPDKTDSKEKSKVSVAREKINLNTADTTLLKTLSGIGSYFAKKMVDYRERLGGYYAVEQLLEIYNFGEERLQKIKPYIDITLSDIKKINFATDTIVNIIGKHPYLGFKAARTAIKIQRSSKSKITIEELVNQKIISTEQGEKLKPYLAD